MVHRREIDSIIAQVAPWPVEDRMALAYGILHDARAARRPAAPRNTLSRALGIAAGTTSAPDDAAVDRWVEEYRLQKHG